MKRNMHLCPKCGDALASQSQICPNCAKLTADAPAIRRGFLIRLRTPVMIGTGIIALGTVLVKLLSGASKKS